MAETFPMIPATSKPFWILIPILVVLFAGLLVLFAYIAYSSQNVRFELSDEGLRLRGDLYGRLIPASALISEQARKMDLTESREYQPRWRTFGTGLPGYRAGWFRLRNREKALLYVTDGSRVVYIPTRDNYSVLLSVAEPERFLQALSGISRGG